MPESDGNPMAESDKFFLPLCDKFFWGRVIIDLGTIIVPNTVRQIKFLKTRVRQVVWSMSLSGIHTCTFFSVKGGKLCFGQCIL